MVLAAVLLVLFLVAVFVVSIIRYNRRRNRDMQERQLLQRQFEQELLQMKLETQEATFHQIGQELHDNVAQLLGSARLMLGITQRQLQQTPETLITADKTLEQAISELRSLSKSLNREWLHQFNLLRNVQGEVDRLNNTVGVEVHLNASVDGLPLSADAQLMLFRIVQEALQNCMKHAQAARIDISLHQKGEHLEVHIADDGIGFNPQGHITNGVGLMNMRHRVHLLGGTIHWKAHEPTGTRVHIILPAKEQAS